MWASKGETRMTDRAGWNVPVCMYEHASSQRMHPVHRSGVMRRTFTGHPYRQQPPSPFLSPSEGGEGTQRVAGEGVIQSVMCTGIAKIGPPCIAQQGRGVQRPLGFSMWDFGFGIWKSEIRHRQSEIRNPK